MAKRRHKLPIFDIEKYRKFKPEEYAASSKIKDASVNHDKYIYVLP